MSFEPDRARRSLGRTRLAVATALVLYGSHALAHTAFSPHAASDHVLLPAGVYTGERAGARLIHDYGAFQLWRVDAAHRAELATTAPDVVSLRSPTIDLPSGRFDPLHPPQSATSAIVDKWPSVRGDNTLYAVQFVGPVTAEWLAQIRAAGATPVQYINRNAYLVLANDRSGRNLAALANSGGVVRYAGQVQPVQKLSRAVSRLVEARPGDSLKVSVVVAQHSGMVTTQRAIEGIGSRLTDWTDARGMFVAHFAVSPDKLPQIAAFGDVMTISSVNEKKRTDEVQTQIIAGNLSSPPNGPSGPGYGAWLAALGLSTTPADYPLLAIVDDGVGDGTTVAGAGDERLTLNGDGATSRVELAISCSSEAPESIGGHGHINATIAAGYDVRPGLPFTDPNGFLRGQGINPWARVANFFIFGPDTNGDCGSDDMGLVEAQGAAGVKISSNSWGYGSIFGPATDYLDTSRFHDIGTRDAGVAAGDQPVLFVFAAGNDDVLGVAAPGNAKNVLTVGASENQRPSDESGSWTDGCGTGPTGADSAMDVASFSSLGPAVGGRAKPEVIAPGTHIQGSASTSPGYDGSGVCDEFRPLGQTEFAASSGTSHSTPAIAGVNTLYFRHLQDELGVEPSPALVKGYTIAHPTYLTGVGANDSLPSNSQGYGMPNMTYAFDDSIDRYLEDQDAGNLFTAAGQTQQWFGATSDPSQPTRVVLTWTDAPGAIDAADPSVNNLDLKVTVGGVEYFGNNFTGQWSNTDTTLDAVNNTEVVFLPAGTGGGMEITITATNISADGVPGNASPLDQDYALVVINGTQSPTFIVDAAPSLVLACGTEESTAQWDVDVGDVNGYTGTVTLSTDNAPSGTSPTFSVPSGTLPPAFESQLTLTTSGLADGSYTFDVVGTDDAVTPAVRTDTVSLQYSAAAATAATPALPADEATLQSLTPTFSWTASASGAPTSYTLQVSETEDFAVVTYEAEVAGTSHIPTTPLSGATTYYWRVIANNGCGGTASPALSFSTVPVFCSTSGVAIPDNFPAGVDDVITVSAGAGGILSDLDVSFKTNHTWAADLILTVTQTGGDTVIPFNRPTGCSGENANLVMDDEGTAGSVQDDCVDGDPAYTPPGGHFTPAAPLSVFDGDEFSGTWTLNVSDNANLDTGVIQEWCLIPTFAPPVVAEDDSYTVDEDSTLTEPAPGVLENDTTIGADPLTAVLGTGPTDGALTLDPDGSFDYTPDENACGTDSFTYSATDGTETSELATVTIEVACVNDAPVAASDAYVGFEDTVLTVAAAQGVLANDTDAEGGPLIANLVSGPTNGGFSLQTDGGFTYTPDEGYCGEDAFTYRANDGLATSAATEASITVTCGNVAPVAGSIADLTVVFGTAIELPGGEAFSDDDGDTLTFSQTGLPAFLTFDATTGDIAGTPGEADIGSYSITVTAEDPDGETASASFTLTVVGLSIFADGFED